jgi:hypothetical protein
LSRVAFAHAHETPIRASKGRGHTFNYGLINALILDLLLQVLG